MNAISTKTNSLPVKNLKEMAKLLMADMREGSEIVFNAVIEALEAKLPEAEFVSFCAELED